MKKDNLEFTIIILATSVILLIIMTTILVAKLEEKILEEPFTPPNEEKIEYTPSTITKGVYLNTSDIENHTNIVFNEDKSFIFNYNNCEEQIHLTGIYQVDNNYIYMTILDDVDFEKEFTIVILSDNLLEYRGQSIGCSPFEYSVYMLKN